MITKNNDILRFEYMTFINILTKFLRNSQNINKDSNTIFFTFRKVRHIIRYQSSFK